MTRTILTIALFFLHGLLLAQRDVNADHRPRNNALYTRLGLMEWGLGYERKIKENFSLGVEVDYRPRFQEAGQRKLSSLHGINLSMYAFRVKVPIIFIVKPQSVSITFAPSFRTYASRRLIEDSGWFGGCNSCDYSEYSESAYDFSLNTYMNLSMRRAQWLEFYFGIGVGSQYYRRHYSIEGAYSFKKSSDRIEYGNRVLPAIFAGFKFYLVRFP